MILRSWWTSPQIPVQVGPERILPDCWLSRLKLTYIRGNSSSLRENDQILHSHNTQHQSEMQSPKCPLTLHVIVVVFYCIDVNKFKEPSSSQLAKSFLKEFSRCTWGRKATDRSVGTKVSQGSFTNKLKKVSWRNGFSVKEPIFQ